MSTRPELEPKQQPNEPSLRSGPSRMWGESELAQLMRAHDWSRTSLGPVSTWPQSLQTAVSLILNSQHPMWIGWGPEAIFLYNDAYIQVLSQAKHPWALGRRASEVWAEIWDVCGPLADKVFEKGEATFVDEVRLFMNRGDFLEETYYSFSYNPIRNEAGEVSGLFCPSAEVTAKVLNARRLRTLSELSAAAFVERTVEKACVSATQTLAKNPDDVPFAMLYVSSSNDQTLHVGGTAGLLGHGPKLAESLRGKNEAQFAEVLRTGRAVEIAVSDVDTLTLGPGEQKVKEALLLPVKSLADDRVIGILVAGISPTRKLDDEYRTFYDLVSNHVATAIANALAYQEQRKRAETLAELDRAKTTFFSNVSHEFRTPLTLMLGPLEQVLAEPDGMTPDSRHLVELAERNGTRLLKLVNSLLDFSRIEAGRANVSFRPVDLASFTTELASMFRPATDRANVKLIIDCEALPQPVYIDGEMWEKIVLNLLSNAFKFTFQGEIAVLLEDRGDGAELRVRDTGVGIPENELPRIFERFHRVQGAKGRSFEGSGIGLSLVQELVKLHGGTIAVESELNRGTEFRLWLPYGREHLPQDHLSDEEKSVALSTVAAPYVAEALSWIGVQPLQEESVPLASGTAELPTRTDGERRSSVLLVDDNNDMREYVARLLEGRFRVRTASNGKDALELARRNPPELVLTDVMMPEMSGFELLAELRKNPATATVPIIFLSARAGEESRIEGLQQGADDYLVKPFSARELLARVENNLALSRLRRETEKKIRESEERFRALVSASSDVIYRMSPDWREMRQLQGRDFIPDTERPSFEWLERYIHPEDRARVMEAIQEAIRTKGKFELEHRVMQVDGSVGWTASRAIPMLDGDGNIVEWFGTATDITARKQAEQALLRSEQLASVGRMAAAISHEINNPLEAVTNMLFIAQGVTGLPDTVREYLDVADGELKRIAHITRQSLGFYRESNAPTRTLVNAVLESTIDLLTNRIKAKNVVIEKQWRGTVQAVAVAGELRQVFSNLLSNSLDAIGEDGVIKMRCSNVTTLGRGRMVRVTIADNGKGIEPAAKQHLFEAFFTTKGTIGTGLGLWVSKQILDKHRGVIRVRSSTSGNRRGTSFSILLPEAFAGFPEG